jgi:MFS family permease
MSAGGIGPAGPRGLLAEPAVLRLWLAGVGAGVMRWLEMLALSLWVFAETGSAVAVTLIAFARMLPLLLLGAAAGAVADCLDRRRLLCGWYLILAAASLLLAGLAAIDRLTVPLVAALALLSGVFWTFEMPVRRTMLAEAAGMARVNASMGLEMTSNQATRLLGPMIGGWLIGSAGIMGVLALGALLYGAGAALLAGVGGWPPAGTRRLPGVIGQLREGFAYVRGTPLVLAVIVSTALFNLWYLPYVALAPVVAETTMRLAPGPIGVLVASEGIGAIAGSLWIATMARPAWFRLAYALGGTAIAVAVLAFAWAAEPVSSFVLLMLGGFGIACFATMQTSLLLIVVPPAMRVRAMGVLTLAIGTAPLGFAITGALAEWLGPRLALGAIAAFGAVSMLTCMAIWRPLRLLEAPRPEAETTS